MSDTLNSEKCNTKLRDMPEAIPFRQADKNSRIDHCFQVVGTRRLRLWRLRHNTANSCVSIAQPRGLPNVASANPDLGRSVGSGSAMEGGSFADQYVRFKKMVGAARSAPLPARRLLISARLPSALRPEAATIATCHRGVFAIPRPA